MDGSMETANSGFAREKPLSLCQITGMGQFQPASNPAHYVCAVCPGMDAMPPASVRWRFHRDNKRSPRRVINGSSSVIWQYVEAFGSTLSSLPKESLCQASQWFPVNPDALVVLDSLGGRWSYSRKASKPIVRRSAFFLAN